jgi:hypothetical protein
MLNVDKESEPTFDLCEHKIRRLIIKAAASLRVVKGLPEEKNITILYAEGAEFLGIPVVGMSSDVANRLPDSTEMKDDRGQFILPRKDCPKCGTKGSVVIAGVCHNCEDGKKGFKSKWFCSASKECGYFELSERPVVSWLNELNPDWQGGMKAELGIRTATDEGLK